MTTASKVKSTASSDTSALKTEDTTPSVEMFGKMLTFTRIKLKTADLDSIAEHLNSLLTNKTSQIPVVIDSDIEQDLPAVIDLFWSWGLQPIGVIAGILESAAKQLKLAVFPAEGRRIKLLKPVRKSNHSGSVSHKNSDIPQRSNSKLDSKIISSTSKNPLHDNFPSELGDDAASSLIYDQMLRSGQSLNHVGGDLILTQSVNNGAEAISDNCLHIYGRAQGRLVAGATGDKDARIFCQQFNPSLVSVAGTYCLKDNIPAEYINKAVQVSFKEGEGLIFQYLNKS